jgi:DNA polymerase-3 subunit alpha
MVQLSEMRDTMIKELHLVIPIEEITDSFVAQFTDTVKANKGTTLLRLTVSSRQDGVNVNLFSKRYKVALTSELVDYLDTNEFKYTLS